MELASRTGSTILKFATGCHKPVITDVPVIAVLRVWEFLDPEVCLQCGELLDGNRHIRRLYCATTRSGDRYRVCAGRRSEIYLAAPAVTTTTAKYHSQENEHDQSKRCCPALSRLRNCQQEKTGQSESRTRYKITRLVIRMIRRLQHAAQTCRS